MKVRDFVKLLEAHGWEMTRQESSHRQFRQPGNPNVITVNGHPGEDIAKGTLSANLKKARLK